MISEKNRKYRKDFPILHNQTLHVESCTEYSVSTFDTEFVSVYGVLREVFFLIKNLSLN